MRRLGLLLLLIAAAPKGPALASWPALSLSPRDRVLILSPHPDDDILACAGVIQQALRMKRPVRVVYLTNGDNYEWAFMFYKKRPVLRPAEMQMMGRLRRQEAEKAEALLGLSPDHLAFLGYPDWGTEQIFMQHWGPDEPPFRSMLTKVNQVPYPDAFHPKAPYKGEAVLGDLERLIGEFKPTKIFVSHPADSHRDHRTFYLFMKVALWDLEDKMRPEVFPYLVHFPHWPLPRKLLPDRRLEPPDHFAHLAWVEEDLSARQVQAKIDALALHATQMAKDRSYLDSFVAVNELFADYPDVDLGGRLHNVAVPLPPKAPAAAPDQMPQSELSWKHIYKEGDNLVVRVEFSTHSYFNHPVNVYFFGYRRDRPFADMPKIRLLIHHRRVEVFDQSRALPDSGVLLEQDGRQELIRIPLRLLGDPQRLIGSAWSRSAEEPFDWRVWRVIRLEGSHAAR